MKGGLRGGLRGGFDLQHVASRLFTAAKMQVVLKARGVSGEVTSMQASDGGKSSLCKCDNRLKHALHTKWSNYWNKHVCFNKFCSPDLLNTFL